MSTTVMQGKSGPVGVEEDVSLAGKAAEVACPPWPIPPPNTKPEVKFTKLFINNEWVSADDNSTMEIINPSNESIIAKVATANKTDVDRAVAAAKEAFAIDSEWRQMDASKRGELMLKLADAIDDNKHYLACLESLNSGKPYTHAFFMDTLGISKTLRYYAGWTDKMHGKTMDVDGDYLSYTKMQPLGVCGLLLPWNMPLISIGMKLSPALCCGNTVVVKPSEFTPLTALYIASLAREVGFPKGVINVISGGPETGRALAEHPDVEKISLTGSVKTGQAVQQSAAVNFKKLTLELSGKCPVIVFPDVDVDSVVEQCHQAAFMNQGQMCTAGSRTYVHETIYDEFVAKSIGRAKARMVTDPFQLFCEQGPQISKGMMENVLNLLKSGEKEGVKIECGGKRRGTIGYYIEPTILTNLHDDMEISHAEIFGPVQCIYKFTSTDDVIKSANNSKYGLATGIYSNDITKALEVASRIEIGTSWINCYNAFSPLTPFGGCKMSGKGKEMGEAALAEYSDSRTTVIKLPKTLGLASATLSTYASKQT